MRVPGFDLLIRGRRVLADEERPAAVGIRDGRIAAIEPADVPLSATHEVALADDEVLIPGLVDTHVHVNEPGRTEWEGFASATKAAAAGGVTTIVDMPLNSIPPTVDLQALEAKRRATDGQRFVDVGLWGGAVPASLGRLAELHEAGVFGFKCFLVHSGVDEFPPLDGAELDAAMREVAALDGLLIVHAEDAMRIADAPDCSGTRYAEFLASRPHDAEDVAVGRVVELAVEHSARVHILHLSSADALPLLARARNAGARVTVETCPHYLTLTAEEIGEGHTEFKCCPPIRDRHNQERLWQGLAEGVIDCVVSDHSPSTADLKRRDTGDFGEAWGGISSLQLGLPLVWTAGRERGHALADVVTWMARRPAEIAGLDGKGRIAVGGDADLAVFAPDESFEVDPGRLHHRNPVTPYTGRKLSGVVRQTWLRGRRIVGGVGDFDVPTGRLLSRRGDRR